MQMNASRYQRDQRCHYRQPLEQRRKALTTALPTPWWCAPSLTHLARTV